MATLAFTVAPAAGQAPDGESTAAAETAVRDLWRNILSTFEEGDAAGFTALTCDDAILLPPGGPPLEDPAGIRDLMGSFFGSFRIEIQEATLHEVMIHGEWAYARDSYRNVLHPISGGEGEAEAGKNVWLFRRQADGSWKIFRNMWNSNG